MFLFANMQTNEVFWHFLILMCAYNFQRRYLKIVWGRWIFIEFIFKFAGNPYKNNWPAVHCDLVSNSCSFLKWFKGQLISEAIFLGCKSPKKQTKFFEGFLPYPSKMGHIKEINWPLTFFASFHAFFVENLLVAFSLLFPFLTLFCFVFVFTITRTHRREAKLGA